MELAKVTSKGIFHYITIISLTIMYRNIIPKFQFNAL